ncbi:hypothetical protein C496_03853 [Natronorubrum tibetense GA33]|uniref:Uncharacterized protein n=2 Tax=Natronorubrum tibetense TaxID=63128 RepID=L9W7R2_9EURY|nr:hypothetical protein C496_03853 [Natronorubrum tibetense GA33]
MRRHTQSDDDDTDGDGTLEQRTNELVEALNENGFDDVSVDKLDADHPEGEYMFITFGTELDRSDGITGKRAKFEDGEPAALITLRSEDDTYGITVGYGTERGYNIEDQYAIVDTSSEAVQAAKHWFENEA